MKRIAIALVLAPVMATTASAQTRPRPAPRRQAAPVETAPAPPPPEPAAAPIAPAAAETEEDEQDEEEHEPRRWETPVRPVRPNILSLYPYGFINRGVAIGYERALPNARFTVGGRMGLAFPASGDFTSHHVSFGVEGRYYVLGRGPFTRFEGKAPVGLYLGVRLGITHVALDDATGAKVGSYDRLALATTLGYRFTIRGVFEFTPFLGGLFYADVYTNLPITVRPTPVFGASVGAMFGHAPPAPSRGT